MSIKISNGSTNMNHFLPTRQSHALDHYNYKYKRAIHINYTDIFCINCRVHAMFLCATVFYSMRLIPKTLETG